jgi:hypothetical protein
LQGVLTRFYFGRIEVGSLSTTTADCNTYQARVMSAGWKTLPKTGLKQAAASAALPLKLAAFSARIVGPHFERQLHGFLRVLRM